MAESSERARKDELPGIPGYRIDDVIGRGATGVVYRATQLAVDRPVAIKILHAELCTRTKAVRRLKREARTAARLAHPGIASAIDMGEVEGRWWYAMELVEGDSLAVRLRERQTFSERAALRLLIPLTEALQHAFENGVVHRDIKPANILIEESGRGRLVDLGLAFTEEDPLLTQPGGTLGTPHYVSPEQARNPQAADVRSDIWSFGATMFHMLCGRPPFSGSSVAEILSGVLYKPIPNPFELNPKLSKDLALVLRKCLARDPDRRYQEPKALLDDLELIRERRPVHVERAELDPVQGERQLSDYLPWIMGTVAAAVFVAVIVWRPWLPRGNAPGGEDGRPLQSIALENFRNPGTRDAKLLGWNLDQLDKLQPNLPGEYRADFDSVLSDTQTAYDKHVEGVLRTLRADFKKALEDRDFQTARSFVESAALHRRIGEKMGALTQAQLEQFKRQLDIESLRGDFAAARSLAFGRLREQLHAHYDGVVMPKVDSLRGDQGRWADAHLELSRPTRTRMEFPSYGLPADDVAEYIDAFDSWVGSNYLRQLEKDWETLDLRLRDAVEEDFTEIASDLRAGRLERSAVKLLRERFAVRSGYVPSDQFLRSISESFPDHGRVQLEQRARELAQLEQEQRELDARVHCDELDEALASHWDERRYDEIAAAWTEARSREWLAPERVRIENRRQEAELLEGLLARAATRLEELDGRESTILLGTIELRGEIVAPVDVLENGFRVLTGRQKTEQFFSLRAPDVSETTRNATKLSVQGIEKLLQLPVDPGLLESKDRLALALLLDREERLADAIEVFESGSRPSAEYAALIAAFAGRLRASEADLEARQLDQTRDAEGLIRQIRRDDDPTSDEYHIDMLRRRIDQLLDNYSHLEAVKNVEDEMRARRRALDEIEPPSAEERIERAFAPSMLEFDGDRAKLTYVMDEDHSPAWDRGSWSQDLDGWISTFSDEADLVDDRQWPRLVLRSPLRVKDKMTVEITIEKPPGTGEPLLLVVSVAGTHVALVGTPTPGEPDRFLLRSGGRDELIDLLAGVKAREGDEIDGLRAGGTHTLRLELTNRRGQVNVWLDGKELNQTAQRRPSGKPGSQSIVLRSLDPVLLRQVAIDAAFERD